MSDITWYLSFSVGFISFSVIISRSIIFPYIDERESSMVLDDLNKFTQLIGRRARIWTKGLLVSKVFSNNTKPPPISKTKLFNLSQLMEKIIYSSLPRLKLFPVDNSTLGINNKCTCCPHLEILLIKCQKVQAIGKVELRKISRESTIILTLFL